MFIPLCFLLHKKNSATRIRTWKCWNQNPVPYHLAIALYYDSKRIKRGQEDSNPRPFGP